jgi:hypothetical protein
MNFNERFIEGRPIANFETAFNMYLDEEGATFEDAQKLFNECQMRRAYSEKRRRDIAQAEIEKQANAEQDWVDAEKAAHLDRLRQQYRDTR